MGKTASVVCLILTLALTLDVLSVVTIPVTKKLTLASYGDYQFGIFGYCNIKEDTCTHASIGYHVPAEQTKGFTLPSQARQSLTNLLVVHVIAAGLTLVVLVMAVCTLFAGPGSSPQYLTTLLMFILLTFLVTLLAFLVDILVFLTKLSWEGWVILASTILVAIAGSLLCIMRRKVSSQRAATRHKDPDESLGSDFHRMVLKPFPELKFDDKSPEFATAEKEAVQHKKEVVPTVREAGSTSALLPPPPNGPGGAPRFPGNHFAPGNQGPAHVGWGGRGPANQGPGDRGPGNMGPGGMGPGNMDPGIRGPGNRGPWDNRGPSPGQGFSRPAPHQPYNQFDSSFHRPPNQFGPPGPRRPGPGPEPARPYPSRAFLPTQRPNQPPQPPSQLQPPFDSRPSQPPLDSSRPRTPNKSAPNSPEPFVPQPQDGPPPLDDNAFSPTARTEAENQSRSSQIDTSAQPPGPVLRAVPSFRLDDRDDSSSFYSHDAQSQTTSLSQALHGEGVPFQREPPGSFSRDFHFSDRPVSQLPPRIPNMIPPRSPARSPAPRNASHRPSSPSHPHLGAGSHPEHSSSNRLSSSPPPPSPPLSLSRSTSEVHPLDHPNQPPFSTNSPNHPTAELHPPSHLVQPPVHRTPSPEYLDGSQATSPAISDASNFTSVSQRPINPRYYTDDDSAAVPAFGPSRGVARSQARQDLVLQSNPDFQLSAARGKPRTKALPSASAMGDGPYKLSY